MRIFHNTALLALLLALAPGAGAQTDAAETADKEEGKVVVVPKAKMPLWGQDNMDGWDFVVKDGAAEAEDVWSIKDGVVRCEGTPFGFMRTKAEYANYRLRLEWRWVGEGGNSGVLLHCQGPNVCTDDSLFPKCVEAQLKSGGAGDVVIMYGARVAEIERDYAPGRPFLAKPKDHDSNEKPLGEWNVYDIICKGDTIALYVNGLLQNTVTGATPSAGSIALQSEGGVIEFRNATVAPLESGMFVHTVLFWMKDGVTDADRARMEKGLESLRAIPSVAKAYFGKPAETDRAIIDASYDYGLTVIFDSEAKHGEYQVDPIHDAFRDDLADLWEKVLIYDFE